MKKYIGIIGISTLVACIQPAMADQLSVTFTFNQGSTIPNSNTESEINFVPPKSPNAETFSFSAASAGLGTKTDFVLSNATNFTGGVINGLFGDFTGISSVGSFNAGDNAYNVTGTGQLVIFDPKGTEFTAALAWGEISQTGFTGELNPLSNPNLSGASYGGTDLALIELAAAINGSGDGYATGSYTIPKPTPKTKAPILTSSTFSATSYNGTIAVTALPEPGFYGVLCVALISLFGVGKVLAGKARRSQKS